MRAGKTDFQKRLSALRQSLRQRRLDSLLVTSRVNVRYLTGFTGAGSICFVSKEQAVFVTDFRYLDQARLDVQDFSIVIAAKTLFDGLKQENVISPSQKIGFEAAHLRYSHYLALIELFPNTSFEPTENMVESIAIRKEPDEISYLAEAANIADSALARVLPFVKAGKKEFEIAAKLSYRMRCSGAEKDSFDPVVASGWRSALPHGMASDKVIDDGDFLVMDFGAVYKGYASDITRTVAVGKASPNMKMIYGIVKDAQQKAIDAARAGMTCDALDRVARDYIHQKGFGQYFGHSLGHGLGLEVHSPPRVGAGSETVLEENFVITIEPGIYIPNVGGVRIEDDIVIQKDGAGLLTHFSRELLEIE
ncbi:putative peptidase [bacterium BMS3Bbin03]|nr:putative peptidase [bacterium BMS3Bbin03]